MAIRSGDWKAVKLNAGNPAESTIELYDLSSDTGETNDLAASKPELVKKLEQMMNDAHVPSDIFPFPFETDK